MWHVGVREVEGRVEEVEGISEGYIARAGLAVAAKVKSLLRR